MTDNSNSSILGSFYYVLGSQAIVLVSGVVKALVVPIVLGLSDYGYWQIYVFYTIYIGVFTFGYGDGLYLRYGGWKLADLPLPRLRSANALYLVLLIFGCMAVVAFASANADPNRQLVFFAVAANVAVLGVTSNISLTLQATNKLRGYAFLNSADKIFFGLALLVLFQDDFRTFQYLIAADIGAKIIVLALLLARYHQLFIGAMEGLSDAAKEFAESIGSGIQLLIANLAGMLVLGVGRIIVEYFGRLESYAYYAFAVSLSSVVLMSVTALSIVIYPVLRRQPKENFLGYFNRTTEAYALFILVMLTGYFPAVAFVDLVATQYAPVIEFLNVMFLITVLQGKMQLVNNTYYKALRLERSMLWANVNSLLFASVLSLAGFLLTQSVLVIAYAALVTMVFRVYASETFLRRRMGEGPSSRHLIELLALSAFLLITLLPSFWLSAGVWMVFIVTVAKIKRASLGAILREIQEGK